MINRTHYYPPHVPTQTQCLQKIFFRVLYTAIHKPPPVYGLSYFCAKFHFPITLISPPLVRAHSPILETIIQRAVYMASLGSLA